MNLMIALLDTNRPKVTPIDLRLDVFLIVRDADHGKMLHQDIKD
ncbi:MAG TPA: hypothetical protein VM260_14645 [Pirellula sp.]|nr:hypothetical protein [Pirellula sp.]